ncbi:RNA polymerase sigma factor [Pseudogemmobacter bohemicus]|uniref:RNA polymerase sigma factor n=1 Tax=Pseudogemmobacter bohemicus TaxID=2250708 RepID=UPI001E53310E|nr:RNA polymerase sigma factor [Pseudogemmobacter bohemicus]
MAASEGLKADMVRLLPRLRAFARSLVQNSHGADDLVQATCEKALRNLEDFTPGTRLDSWLFRIMRNGFIDQTRARRRLEPIEDAPESALIGEDGRETAHARLELQAVERAMAALPEEQRAVLMLVCVEGMRYREVAEVLEIPEGTVMSRLARARRALAVLLEGGQSAAEQGR